jgi:NitT/TauT family transport system permease protein
LIFIGLWQLLSGRVIPNYAISDPRDVWDRVVTSLTTESGWADIGVTAKELVIGFAMGIGVGTILGIVLGTVRVLGAIVEPFISVINMIPKIALAPVFILVLGIGTWTDAVIASLMVSIILFYNLFEGMRDINRDLVTAVRLAGGRRVDVLKYVTAPSLVTPFFAGIKAAAPFAILGVIVGEFVASYNGLGHVLSATSTNLDAAGVYDSVILLIALGLAINGVLSLVYRLVTRRLGMT